MQECGRCLCGSKQNTAGFGCLAQALSRFRARATVARPATSRQCASVASRWHVAGLPVDEILTDFHFVDRDADGLVSAFDSEEAAALLPGALNLSLRIHGHTATKHVLRRRNTFTVCRSQS